MVEIFIESGVPSILNLRVYIGWCEWGIFLHKVLLDSDRPCNFYYLKLWVREPYSLLFGKHG